MPSIKMTRLCDIKQKLFLSRGGTDWADLSRCRRYLCFCNGDVDYLLILLIIKCIVRYIVLLWKFYVWKVSFCCMVLFYFIFPSFLFNFENKLGGCFALFRCWTSCPVRPALHCFCCIVLRGANGKSRKSAYCRMRPTISGMDVREPIRNTLSTWCNLGASSTAMTWNNND